MKTRRLGRTGLQVSEMVFGGGWVGGILIDADDETRIEALKRAFEAGVNWIDTAPGYGQGASEEALGLLLPELARMGQPKPFVSTKVRVDVDDMANLASQIKRSLEESLGRLKMDSVDLFQLHNPIEPETGDGLVSANDVLRDGGVADVLDDLRDQGYFRHTGITALGDTACLGQVVDSGRFDTAQVYYNLLNSSAGRSVGKKTSVQDFDNLLERMRAVDMGALGIRVFAAGVIATDSRTGREIMVARGTDVEKDQKIARAVFSEIGSRHGTRAQTAVRYVLADERVGGTIFGLATLDHLDETLAAVKLGPLADSDISVINGLVDSVV